MNRAVIFANGVVRDYSLILPLLQSRDFIMAADGGLKHIHRLKLKPTLVIGDLDSISASDLDIAEFQQTEIMRFEKDKNETDLELAIRAAMDRGYREILIVAGLGGRLDQTMANLLLILHPDFQKCSITFDDGVEEVCLVRGMCEIKGNLGDIVSLIPLQGNCEGVQTENLKYPLQNETLIQFKTRGISNVMTATQATVSISKGIAFCIHTRKSL
ncbi:MAG: thiamine diphosphokinase [Anaerolineaceae bacterium]